MQLSKSFTDHELLSLLKNEDQVALQYIYNQYWKKLYLSAFSITRDAAVCDDIVQEVLLQLWVRKDEIVINCLRSYLFMAVRYKVLTYIKSAGNQKVFLEPGELEKLGGIEELDDHLQVNEIQELLDLGISTLPERCQQVFVLSRKEYLSNREIAERMGISVKTVENQMTIALKQLRVFLVDYLPAIYILLFIPF